MHRLIPIAMALLLGLLIAAAPGGREAAAQQTRQAKPNETIEFLELIRDIRNELNRYLSERPRPRDRLFLTYTHFGRPPSQAATRQRYLEFLDTRPIEDFIIDPDPRIGLPWERITIMGGDGDGAGADAN